MFSAFHLSACAVVAGCHLDLIFVTVVRNEVEGEFKEDTSMAQIYVVSPQGIIKD